jgi:hypothetical protein
MDFSDGDLTLLVVYDCTDLDTNMYHVVRVVRCGGPRVADRPTDIMADQPHNPFIEVVVRVLPTKPADIMADQLHNPSIEVEGGRDV